MAVDKLDQVEIIAIDEKTVSSYLQYLPAVFSEDREAQELNAPSFLGRFLLAFEQILTGLDSATHEADDGLEQTVARLATLFEPQRYFDPLNPPDPKVLPWPVAWEQNRDDFISWLAGWVALSLRADWTVEQQRDFLANIVPLYRRRGTRDNLAELLRIYTRGKPEIDDGGVPGFQIGKHSTIGKDTYIGGSIPPHFFQVRVLMSDQPNQELQERQRLIARALIDLQKPAHTAYKLTITFGTTMQIGKRSTIGKDTLLGDIPV
jgi:phage tail-like protein